MLILYRLEYRLLDKSKGYPTLYHYERISREEISVRFQCDYFIKDGIVYEKTSTALEPLLLYVIYVQRSVDETAKSYPTVHQGHILVEIREYLEHTSEYPLITSLQFTDYMDLILHLQANYLTMSGLEYEKTSTEIDEDSKRYVIYVTPSKS